MTLINNYLYYFIFINVFTLVSGFMVIILSYYSLWFTHRSREYIYIYIFFFFFLNSFASMKIDISGITNYAEIDFILLIFKSKNLMEYLSIKFRAVIL